MTQQMQNSVRPSGYDASYHIVGKLGAGGMGRVYLAILEGVLRTRRKVVLKLPLSLRDAVKWRKDFEAEARVMVHLNHPNIVRVLDWTELDGLPCMVSEYIDGFELHEVIKYFRGQGRCVPLRITAQLMMQTCQAIEYIHNARTIDHEPLNIVHRDIDASNIMLSQTGYVKVIDFGIAKHTMQEELTRPGMYKGKIVNFPPDIFLPDKVDQRADIFGLGILLYELLTARRPRHFTATETISEIINRIKTVPIPAPSHVVPGIPKSFDAIVAKATALNRDERYSTAKEMYDDLQALSREFSSGPDHMYMENWIQTDLAPLTERRARQIAALQQGGADNSFLPELAGIRVHTDSQKGKRKRNWENRIAAMRLRLKLWKSMWRRQRIWKPVPLLVSLGAIVLMMTSDVAPGTAIVQAHSDISVVNSDMSGTTKTSDPTVAAESFLTPRPLMTTMLPAVPVYDRETVSTVSMP
ncbi:MAG: serine/threonine protein kinase [Deltaproteobacteria bacterium]|nr:serine/threonine protein kinase [Deltaproteobacteria bacterium]